MFTPEQKEVLMKYFEEYGMTSTHRRNTELMKQCASEVGTTVARVKVSWETCLGSCPLYGRTDLRGNCCFSLCGKDFLR